MQSLQGEAQQQLVNDHQTKLEPQPQGQDQEHTVDPEAIKQQEIVAEILENPCYFEGCGEHGEFTCFFVLPKF